MLLRRRVIFSEMGHGKTKPNRWLERCPKMRNLHRCHCMQKFSKNEKTRKTYPPVSRGLSGEQRKKNETLIEIAIIHKD